MSSFDYKSLLILQLGPWHPDGPEELRASCRSAKRQAEPKHFQAKDSQNVRHQPKLVKKFRSIRLGRKFLSHFGG